MNLAIVKGQKIALSDMVTGYTSTVCHGQRFNGCEPHCHALLSETDWLEMRCCTILGSLDALLGILLYRNPGCNPPTWEAMPDAITTEQMEPLLQ